MTLSATVYTTEGSQRHDDVDAALAAPGETWVHAPDAGPSELDALAERLGIHPLAIEDVRDPETRPKTEAYDDYTFVLLKTASLSQHDDVAFHKEVQTSSVGFFLGDDWLVTASTADLDALDPAAARWATSDRRIAERGTDFVAYRIADALVDDYFDLLDELEGDIEAIEERVLDEPDPSLLQELNDVRRDLLAFRKVVWPAREAVSSLARGDIPQVADDNEQYFRDVADHLVQVVDLVETYRDLTGGTRDVYLNAVAQSTNEVTKTLTVVATIFIPLTFVAGVYGMNFAGGPYAMPELAWRWGYPATMLGMALLGALMLWHFRREDWI